MAKKLYVYARGKGQLTWYIGGYPTGKDQRSTGIKGGKKDAPPSALVRVLAAEQSQLDAILRITGSDGPLTVEGYAKIFLAKITAMGKDAYEHEQCLRNHVVPTIGSMELTEVRAVDLMRIVAAMQVKGLNARTKHGCAPRTIGKVLKTLKVFFKRAMIEERILRNPCESIEPSMLPKMVDHSPTWRAGAVFTRDEAIMVMFDERIPADRRMLYQLLFYAGLRFGESAALTVSCWTAGLEPLGQLLVSQSYQSRTGRVKSTKTTTTRKIPVHPELAALLAAWLAPGGGFERLMGRGYRRADVLVPDVNGHNRNQPVLYKQWKRDLALLGLRHRRIHDTRRSFITWALRDGAKRDTLRWVTHGRETGDTVMIYNEVSWEDLCSQVSPLNLSPPPPTATVIPLHLQATDSEWIFEEMPLVATMGDSPRCSQSAPRQSPTLRDTQGHPNRFQVFAGGDFASEPAIDLPELQVASSVSGAIAALERGDVEAAKAILRGVVA